MLRTTQLHDYHAAHAKLTEFAGYEMPLWYTTTTDEHMAVRSASGIFDVSHMARFEVKGERSTGFLEGLVPTSVGSQPPGKAFYTLLLNDRGGIIDDLIVEKLAADRYMVVVNAANAQTDMVHMMDHAPAGLAFQDVTETTAMVAVQGPAASASLQPLTDLDLNQLKRFRCAEAKVAGEEALVSRTGYTGEDGFEVIVYHTSNSDPQRALRIWERLAETSVPCGLGARDSLRLEAGLPLHGSDIDQGTDPFEADLTWVMTAGKSGFVGASALSKYEDQGPAVIRRGLVLESGIPRHGFDVVDDSGSLGKVTSGTFSPLLRKGVAMCKVTADHSAFGTQVGVLVRDARQGGMITKPPFYDERHYGWKRQKGN
ncbi:MAG: glycine cleavage system aminomethyltransferase GcvT [Nitrososphaerota archaeon]|nr:glycine cleavage system aminomethyltransferase GcvT [Nitrososphaerota archaeon]